MRMTIKIGKDSCFGRFLEYSVPHPQCEVAQPPLRRSKGIVAENPCSDL